MITANMATYPPRAQTLGTVISRIAPQVDVLNIILNAYNQAPPIPDLPANVRFVFPPADLKDTGKFYPPAERGGLVFFVDDDILYPEDYVLRTLRWFDHFGDHCALGFHGSIYLALHQSNLRRLPKLVRTWVRGDDPIPRNRRTYSFEESLSNPVVVDQLGTGVCAMRAEDVPPFDYMTDSQKFVDVRLARWCFEKNITPICLPRESLWLQPIDYQETIYASYTRNSPANVAKEIRSFAFRRSNVGQLPSPAAESQP
jgi:hypothetical protein